MMWKLGVDVFHWADVFLENNLSVLERAKELGFDFVEVPVLDLQAFPKGKLYKKLQDLDMFAVCKTALFSDMGITSRDKDVRIKGREYLKSVVEIAAELKSPAVCGVLYSAWGITDRQPCSDDEWKYSVEIMQEVAEHASHLAPQLTLNMELINRYESNMLNNVEDGIRYCSDVGAKNVKLHLDTYHMILEETSYSRAVRRAIDYMGYVHISESNRGIVGEGNVPWDEFLRALEKNKYQGLISFESFAPGSGVAHFCHVWNDYATSGDELAKKNLENFNGLLSQVREDQK